MQTKKTKVLLAIPEESRSIYDFKGIIENECLDLEYISATLDRERYEVSFWDGKIEEQSLKTKLESFNPDAVFMAGRDFQENFMLEYASLIKQKNPDTITIYGGFHAQLCYERLCRDNVDFVVRSFNPYKVSEIIETLLGNDDPTKDIFSGIRDICYKKDGEWIINECDPADLNTFPRPDRSYFYENSNHYNYLELKQAAWVRTAFCCPYKCKFCTRNKMNMGVYSAREIKDVVDEIAEIKSENIYIVDDDFLVNEKRVKEFIACVKEKNIKKRYICYGRSDFVASHDGIMKELAEIGFYYILVGLETIREGILDEYDKRNSLENNLKSIEICNKYNLNLMGMFILDLDFEKKDFKNLYSFIKKHNMKHVAVSIFTPALGLSNSEEYKDRMITDDPAKYDFLHLVCKPDKLSVNKFYRYYYILLIKLMLKAKKDGIYDFVDYGMFIKAFIKNIFKGNKRDDE